MSAPIQASESIVELSAQNAKQNIKIWRETGTSWSTIKLLLNNPFYTKVELTAHEIDALVSAAQDQEECV